jgi:MFS family permease
MAVEHAPTGSRGFYGSWPQLGVPAGLLLSTIVFRMFSGLPEEQFLSWGWRVPFLISLVLVAIGLQIRLRILETPAFTRIKEQKAESRLLLAAGIRVAENGGFYVYSSFMLVYAVQKVHLDSSVALYGLMIASAAELPTMLFFGWLSDRFGRRPVYLFGAFTMIAIAFPLFRMFDTGSTAFIWLALILALPFSHAAMYAPQAAFLTELFGTRVRYSGASLGAQLAATVAGGLSPLIATELLRRYDSSALSLYLIFMALITIVSVVAASETVHHDITAVS